MRNAFLPPVLALLVVAAGPLPRLHAQSLTPSVPPPDEVAREVRRAVEAGMQAVTSADIQRAVADAVRQATSPDVQRAVADAVRQATSPDVQRAVADAVREATSGVSALADMHVGPQIQDALRGLSYAASGGIAAQSDWRAEQTDRQTRTLALGANGQLNLENLSGNIQVTAGSGRDTTLTIVRRARGRTAADAKLGLDRVQVSVDERSGRATVRPNYPTERGAAYSVSVDYTVTAPAGTQIVTRSVSGDVRIENIHGDLSISTVSGDVTITNAGRVDVRAISGDITVTGASSDGTVSASTTSGTITTRQIKARRLDLATISDNIVAEDIACETVSLHALSGDVRFGGALAPHGRYEMQSHSGDVQVSVTGRTGVEIDAKTFSGDVQSDLPLQATGGSSRVSRHTLRGTYGDGSATLSITTFSGNITVKKA